MSGLVKQGMKSLILDLRDHAFFQSWNPGRIPLGSYDRFIRAEMLPHSFGPTATIS
jgi:hypothetical protein